MTFSLAKYRPDRETYQRHVEMIRSDARLLKSKESQGLIVDTPVTRIIEIRLRESEVPENKRKEYQRTLEAKLLESENELKKLRTVIKTLESKLLKSENQLSECLSELAETTDRLSEYADKLVEYQDIILECQNKPTRSDKSDDSESSSECF